MKGYWLDHLSLHREVLWDEILNMKVKQKHLPGSWEPQPHCIKGATRRAEDFPQ